MKTQLYTAGSNLSGKAMSQRTMAEQVAFHAEQIQANGADAVSGMVDLVADRLVRIATTVTGNQHDGEDAVQASLVQVADSPKFLIDADNAWTYLIRIVRNESLQILRHRKRCPSVEGLADLVVVHRVDEVQRAETHRAVWAALRKLPPEQSEIIVLKVWESMTLAEIADALQLPMGTVASRYRYGMQKLTEMLRSEVEGEIHV